MALVKERANGDKSTTAGMAVYKFSGMPIEQFEHVPDTGDIAVITVRVECTGVGDEQIKDGVRHYVKWKVVNAAIGRELPMERPKDPELPYDDNQDGSAYGDYGSDDPEPEADSADTESGHADTDSGVSDTESDAPDPADDQAGTVHQLPTFSAE